MYGWVRNGKLKRLIILTVPYIFKHNLLNYNMLQNMPTFRFFYHCGFVVLLAGQVTQGPVII